MKRLILVALILGLAGCHGTLAGDRCESSADCDPPLLCSNHNDDPDAGLHGICVLPEALADAAVARDASPVD